jgi:hypothetical protein
MRLQQARRAEAREKLLKYSVRDRIRWAGADERRLRFVAEISATSPAGSTTACAISPLRRGAGKVLANARRKRNQIGESFVAHTREMINCPALRALSLTAVRVLWRLEAKQMNHGGDNTTLR